MDEKEAEAHPLMGTIFLVIQLDTGKDSPLIKTIEFAVCDHK